MRVPELVWPDRVLGPRPTTREVKFVCVAVLACVLLLLFMALSLGPERSEPLGLSYSEDFAGFYGIGRLLNRYPPEWLYDFQAQKEVYLQLRPGETELGLPYVHAPFEALLFQPLALLPYRVAYIAWLLIGLAAYTLALIVVTRRFGPWVREERTVVFLMAYSFSPFAMESWIGGNVAVLAFLALALAVAWEDAGHHVLSGCALSLCLNKPSLLVLILPMLLVSRRIRVLVGFAAGTAVLVSSSAALLGIRAWFDFVDALLWWAERTAVSPGFFRDWKYVDLNAFSRILPGGRSWLGVSMIAGLSLFAILALVRTWLALPHASREAGRLAWAAVLTWSLVLNAYVPIYDCTLLVLGGVLTAAALRDPVSGSLPLRFQTIIAVCYLSAWVTQPAARILHVQVYTLVLVYSGMWLLQEIQQLRSQRLAAAG